MAVASGRSRAAATLASLAVLLAAFAAAARPGVASARTEIGIQDDNVLLYPYGLYNRDVAYDQAEAFGVRAVRFNVIWGEVQRFCVKYRGDCWKVYDDAVDTARRHGLTVQLTVAGTPEYERTLSQSVGFRRPNANRYRAFAVRVAEHFKGRVFRYSIWNEPNLSRWVSPASQAPAYYAKLVRAAYPALKRVDRRNQVLLGELTSAADPLGFLRHMGGGIRADGLAYHPFEFFAAPGRRSRGFQGINSIGAIKRTVRDLARRGRIAAPGRRALPIYFTEFDYQTQGRYARYSRPESKRAAYAVKAMQLAARAGVRQMLWYMLIHPPRSLLNGDVWDGALISLNGRQDATYKALVRNRRSFAGF